MAALDPSGILIPTGQGPQGTNPNTILNPQQQGTVTAPTEPIPFNQGDFPALLPVVPPPRTQGNNGIPPGPVPGQFPPIKNSQGMFINGPVVN